MPQPMTRNDAAAEFLTSLEKQEAGLLAWGVADGSFAGGELDEHARRFLDTSKLWGEFKEPTNSSLWRKTCGWCSPSAPVRSGDTVPDRRRPCG